MSAKKGIYDFFSTNEATLNNYGYPGCARLDGVNCFNDIEKKFQEIEKQKEQLQKNESKLKNLQERFKTKDEEVQSQKKLLKLNKTELTKLRTGRDRMEFALKKAEKKLKKIKPQTLRTFIEYNKKSIQRDFPGSLDSCVLNDEDTVSGDCMNEFQDLLNKLLSFRKTRLTKLLNKYEELKQKLEKDLNVKLGGNPKEDFETLGQEIKDLKDLTQPEAKSKYDTIMEYVKEYVPLRAFLSIIVLILVSCAGAFAAFGGGGNGSAVSFPETSQSQTNLEPGFYGSPFSLPKTSRPQINYFEDLSQFKITPQTRTDLEPGVHKPPLQVPSNLTYDTPFYQKNLKEVQKAVYPVSIYVQQQFGLGMEQATRSIIKQATDYEILRLYESFPENYPKFKFNLKDLVRGRKIFDKIAPSSRNESLTWRVNDSGEGGTSTGKILEKAYDKIPSSGDSLASRTKREHEAEIEKDRQFVIEDIERNKKYLESQGGNNDEDDNDDEPQAKTFTERIIEYMGGIAQGVSDFSDRVGISNRVFAVQQQEKQISGLMMPRTERSRILASRLMY